MQAEVPVVSALYEPTTHTVQADVPVVSALYEPATHALHTAEEDPESTSP